MMMQVDLGHLQMHVPVSAQHRPHSHSRTSELQPYPPAPRGVFRPSKRKSPGGDPCASVDLEPAGTAPESDLFPGLVAGVTAPPPLQRPRRDRSSGFVERRYAEYAIPSTLAPVRTVAVAVRSYPRAEVPLPLAAVNDAQTVMLTSKSEVATTVSEPLMANESALQVLNDVPLLANHCSVLQVERRALAAEDRSKCAGGAVDRVGEETRCTESAGNSLRAVAVRRYPSPARHNDSQPQRAAGVSLQAVRPRDTARKVVLSAVSARLRRSKPRLALRSRYARELAARARAAQRRIVAAESSAGAGGNAERLELGPLQLSARTKVERVVPDLLSAAGVSTRGPFDVDEDASLPTLPALAVPAKTRGESGSDAMALPMLEGVDVFEVRVCSNYVQSFLLVSC